MATASARVDWPYSVRDRIRAEYSHNETASDAPVSCLNAVGTEIGFSSYQPVSGGLTTEREHHWGLPMARLHSPVRALLYFAFVLLVLTGCAGIKDHDLTPDLPQVKTIQNNGEDDPQRSAVKEIRVVMEDAEGLHPSKFVVYPTDAPSQKVSVITTIRSLGDGLVEVVLQFDGARTHSAGRLSDKSYILNIFGRAFAFHCLFGDTDGDGDVDRDDTDEFNAAFFAPREAPEYAWYLDFDDDGDIDGQDFGFFRSNWQRFNPT